MRHSTVPSTTRAAVESVKGFLIPIYTETHDDRQLYGLAPTDFAKVKAGYACPECLADYGEVYRPECPVCGYTRDVAKDFAELPDYWKPDPNDERF